MRVRLLVRHLYLLLPPRASLVAVQSLLTPRLHTPLLFFPPTHTITHFFHEAVSKVGSSLFQNLFLLSVGCINLECYVNSIIVIYDTKVLISRLPDKNISNAIIIRKTWSPSRSLLLIQSRQIKEEECEQKQSSWSRPSFFGRGRFLHLTRHTT